MEIDYDTLRDNSDDEFELDTDADSEINEELEELDEPINIEEEIAESDYLQAIENKFQLGQMDDYTFMLEKLMIDYKRALKNRRFNINNEKDKSKIERIQN